MDQNLSAYCSCDHHAVRQVTRNTRGNLSHIEILAHVWPGRVNRLRYPNRPEFGGDPMVAVGAPAYEEGQCVLTVTDPLTLGWTTGKDHGYIYRWPVRFLIPRNCTMDLAFHGDDTTTGGQR